MLKNYDAITLCADTEHHMNLDGHGRVHKMYRMNDLSHQNLRSILGIIPFADHQRIHSKSPQVQVQVQAKVQSVYSLQRPSTHKCLKVQVRTLQTSFDSL